MTDQQPTLRERCIVAALGFHREEDRAFALAERMLKWIGGAPESEAAPIAAPIAVPAPERRRREARARETREKVWTELARYISVAGLSPRQITLAGLTGLSREAIIYYLNSLERDGYIRRTGSGRSVLLHVTKWPEGISPLETIGREGGAAPAGVAAQDTLPEPIPETDPAELGIWALKAVETLTVDGTAAASKAIANDLDVSEPRALALLEGLVAEGLLEVMQHDGRPGWLLTDAGISVIERAKVAA